MASRTIRDDLYGAMHTALTGNAGFIYRGRDKQTGPQAGLGTLLRLEQWGWIRLVRVSIATPGTSRTRREVAGGWLLPLGRAALRDEVRRRGAAMPARLALPARPDRHAAPVATPPDRPTTPDRDLVALAASVRAAAMPARATRSVTALVDPFALIGSGSRPDADFPF